ncbi:hypothetical protein MC7420_7419 [Coleofasciculus chthonoplastes PCC 7420]|uniref:Uncharacterized protein n=1 Tax=Coleofasciculus chthonoplastes PCC 7420 TaxID=118168 RepID=B4VGY0_9CYAN|nr:hypothetical protein MC7420_7419 [Coleofasciculus chthonoplastes PCC 7420]
MHVASLERSLVPPFQSSPSLQFPPFKGGLYFMGLYFMGLDRVFENGYQF